MINFVFILICQGRVIKMKSGKFENKSAWLPIPIVCYTCRGKTTYDVFIWSSVSRKSPGGETGDGDVDFWWSCLPMLMQGNPQFSGGKVAPGPNDAVRKVVRWFYRCEHFQLLALIVIVLLAHQIICRVQQLGKHRPSLSNFSEEKLFKDNIVGA